MAKIREEGNEARGNEASGRRQKATREGRKKKDSNASLRDVENGVRSSHVVPTVSKLQVTTVYRAVSHRVNW
jgi:hypothetical protein